MKWERLKEYVDTLPDVGIPGCDLIVYQDHQVLFRHMAGFSDAEGKKPVNGNELYWLFSCTKLMTICAAMQLIEKGKLHPDDPVSKYLPAYRNMKVQIGDEIHPAERVMTVRHLMSMQSGLDYDLEKTVLRRVIEESGGMANTRCLVDALAEAPLCFEPGTDYLYSLGHDVVAAIIEVISGERFSDYLNNHIFEPLNLHEFSFSLPEEKESRLADIYMREEDHNTLLPKQSNNYRLTDVYESGGAGLVGCADEFAVFVDAIACRGRGKEGQAILSPEMIQLWSANQLTAQSRRSFDLRNRVGYSYGLGVRTRVDLSIGGTGRIGEFGWDGAAGSWAMIDPDLHLSAFFAMHVRAFRYLYNVVHPTIRSLIYESLI